MAELEYTSRGFRIYHRTEDKYGRKIAIVESSGVEPGIWVQPDVTMDPNRSANMLFSPEDAIDFGLEIIKAAQEKRERG